MSLSEFNNYIYENYPNFTYSDWIEYPSGELKLNRLPHKSSNQILLRFTEPNFYQKLLILAYTDEITHILIPYFPSARDDKGSDDTVSKFLDLLSDKKVTTYDIHNESVLVGYPNVKNRTKKDFICHDVKRPPEWSFNMDEYDFFVAPDFGAAKEVLELGRYYNKPVLLSGKHRNPDGSLNKEVEFYGVENLTCSAVNGLVIDDICDGGGTFLNLVQQFESRFWIDSYYDEKPKLDLYVTHGLFTNENQLKELSKHYGKIITTNCYRSEDEYKALYSGIIDNLRVIKVI